MGCFQLWQDSSRRFLSQLVRAQDQMLLYQMLGFLGRFKRVELAMCPVNDRVSYTGELGWELHHPIEMQNYLFDLLQSAGEIWLNGWSQYSFDRKIISSIWH